MPIKTVSEAPVYCKDCGSRDSWQRKSEADIKSETGRVMWERWVCSICGHSTLVPVRGDVMPATVSQEG